MLYNANLTQASPSDESTMSSRITGIVKAGAGADEPLLDILTKGGLLPYLSVTGKLLFSLLLVVFGIRIFSSSDSGIIHFHARVPILHHHSSLRRRFSAILRELCLHGVLDRKGSRGARLVGCRKASSVLWVDDLPVDFTIQGHILLRGFLCASLL